MADIIKYFGILAIVILFLGSCAAPLQNTQMRGMMGQGATGKTGATAISSFERGINGLSAAEKTETIEIEDSQVYRMEAKPVVKNIKGIPIMTEISRKTRFKQPTVSHNLQRLQKCGFVFVKRAGKERIYGLNKDTIKPLLVLMKTHMKNYCEHNLMD